MGSKEIAGMLKKSPRKGIALCLPTCHPGGVRGGPFSGREGGEKPSEKQVITPRPESEFEAHLRLWLRARENFVIG